MEKIRYSQGPEEAAVGGELFVEARKLRVGESMSGRRNNGGRQHGKTAVARKKAKKWTKEDRDLAEKELAFVILEGQQVRAVIRIRGK